MLSLGYVVEGQGQIAGLHSSWCLCSASWPLCFMVINLNKLVALKELMNAIDFQIMWRNVKIRLMIFIPSDLSCMYYDLIVWQLLNLTQCFFIERTWSLMNVHTHGKRSWSTAVLQLNCHPIYIFWSLLLMVSQHDEMTTTKKIHNRVFDYLIQRYDHSVY